MQAWVATSQVPPLVVQSVQIAPPVPHAALVSPLLHWPLSQHPAGQLKASQVWPPEQVPVVQV